MAGTAGQQKVPETLLPNRCVVPNRPVEVPHLKEFQQIIIEKQAFDFATNPNSEQILRQFETSLEIALYGVVTELCVAAAARSLLAFGYRISLVRDAVAELDAARAEAFVEELISRGGKLVTVNEAIESLHTTAA